MIRSNSIRQKGFSLRRACCLIAVTLLLFSNLRAQVISNNGAWVNMLGGTVVSTKDALNNSGGNIRNDGIFTLSGDYTSSATTLGNGTFNIGRNWTNTGTLVLGTSTVIFNGTGLQTITRPLGEAFYNLSFFNTGSDPLNRIILSNDVNVNNILTLSSGNILPGANVLYLANPSASSLNYLSFSGSRIIGKFEREMDELNNYLFPVGSLSYYNPLNLKPNNILSSGSLVSEFLVNPAPGNAGLPLSDPPVEIYRTFPDGFWNLKANGFSTDDFNINMKAAGFTDTVTTVSRVLKRTNSGDWEIDGTHHVADTVNSVVIRDNMITGISSFGTQFAIGRARPLIVQQPADTIVCEDTYPVFTVIATGAPTLKYTWYKEPGILLQNGSEYTGARTHSLTVNNVQLDDTGRYYCIVTDRYHNSTRTRNAVLHVNKIPVATATPGSQDHECSDVPFTSILLGESYGVPGSTYIWTRDNPAGISSSLPMLGDSLNIGDIIPGMFTNTDTVPRIITFTIIPVGPSPTYCTGLPITATVTVNPVPRAVPVNLKPEICYGGYTSIVLKSPTHMTMGDIKFDYTAAVTGGGSLAGDTIHRDNLDPGYRINLRYTNSSDTLQSVYYYITPKSDLHVCDAGPLNTQEVKVHAVPVQDIITVKSLTCETGGVGLATLRVATSKGAEPFNRLYWTGPVGYRREDSLQIANLAAGKYTVYIWDNLNCNASQFEQVLPIKAIPKIENSTKPPLDLYNLSCIGSNDGTLNVYVTGGLTKPYNYTIFKNSTTVVTTGIFTDNYEDDNSAYRFISGLDAGTYSIVVSDVNGCVSSNQIDITPPEPMIVEFDKKKYDGNFNVSCKGYYDAHVWVKSITGGNGGYRYRWYTKSGYTIPAPVNTYRIDNVKAGWYYLEVTDTLGCMMTDSVEVTQPQGMLLKNPPVLSYSPDNQFNISCNGGSNGSINIDIIGGSGNYVSRWTGPGGFTATTEDVSNIKAGVYTDSIKDLNGCILMPVPVITLSEPDPLVISAVTSSSVNGPYQINCHGGTGSIDITVTGGSTGNYTYTWSTTDGSGLVPGADQPALKAGTYRLVVTDLNNCTAVKDITLTEPEDLTLSLVKKDVTCEVPGFSNGSVDLVLTGGVAPFAYTWSNGATTEDIAGLTAGTYKVRVSYNNTCSGYDSVKIDLPPPLTYNKRFSSFHSYEISCYGQKDGEIHITPTNGKAPFMYTWTGPNGYTASAADLTGLAAGSYTLTISDANLCSATETIILREPGQLGVDFALSQSTAGGYNINCAGERTGTITVQPLNSVNNVNFLWSDGAAGRTRNNLPAGSYTVVITDANNCQASATTSLTEPDTIRIRFDVTQPFCPDMPDGEIRLIVTGGVPGTDYSYKWSDNSSAKVISNIVRGEYKIRVEDLNRCVAKDSIVIEPRNESCLILHNVITPNGDLVNDEWNIGLKELYPEMEVTIFNRWGETVWRSEKGYPKPWDGRSNGHLLPIDSYHYIIDLHNGTKPLVGNVTIVR